MLAASGITAASALNITSGSYGSSTPTYTGAITGHENSGADVTAAQVSLVNVVTAINSLPADATSLPAAVGGVITITPGVYKLDATVIADSLIFSGGPGSTFHIVSSSTITLGSVPSVSLAGGVKEQDIFWLANSGFSTAGSSPPDLFGTVIAQSSASFANGLTLHGAVYAQTGAVTFGGTPAVVTGPVNSCA